MEQLSKSQVFRAKKADAAADIALINQYSQKELKPEDVYCFSVRLCDNDVDRDNERFTDATLEALAPLYTGKTGIFDHQWSAENQIARLYRVETEVTGQKNSLGEPLVILRGSAYMLRTESNQPLIDAIEGGILKEVSVGCSVRRQTCSICGGDIYACEHCKGERYGGKLCYGELQEPTDAYEWSFVAVPAQRGAGVTKGLKDVPAAFDLLMSADLSGSTELIHKLMPKLNTALMSKEERRKRAEIIAENKKFIHEGENDNDDSV